MTLQQIIEDMEQQITNCKESGNPKDESSWGYEEGVLIPWGNAQSIVNALKGSLDAPQLPSNAPTPTYEWTLDDSELQPTKGDCGAMQSNFTAVHEHIDEIGKMIRTLEDAILSTRNPQS